AVSKNKIIYLPLIIHLPNNQTTNTLALLDSGAGGNFIDPELSNEWKLPKCPIDKPLHIVNANGSTNKSGIATHECILHIKINGRKMQL
ncbi:hypothetical protein P691DRAFT_610569, partial [Macrolepiota fuliginosa MF-IS2]